MRIGWKCHQVWFDWALTETLEHGLDGTVSFLSLSLSLFPSPLLSLSLPLRYQLPISLRLRGCLAWTTRQHIFTVVFIWLRTPHRDALSNKTLTHAKPTLPQSHQRPLSPADSYNLPPLKTHVQTATAAGRVAAMLVRVRKWVRARESTKGYMSDLERATVIRLPTATESLPPRHRTTASQVIQPQLRQPSQFSHCFHPVRQGELNPGSPLQHSHTAASEDTRASKGCLIKPRRDPLVSNCLWFIYTTASRPAVIRGPIIQAMRTMREGECDQVSQFALDSLCTTPGRIY